MKKRVADIIADLLVENGITDVFSVVGGGAMFLNDAFGHHEALKVLYNHHEQACSMGAEGYFRATGKIAAVCVTSGPGGTNALTGVMGAYVDNCPMLVVSGQVRYETSIEAMGLNLRTNGEQEFPIIDTVKNMTKYSKMVVNPLDIKYEVEKAIYIAMEGRRGPCWLDIPLNVQGAYVDTDDLRGYTNNEEPDGFNIEALISEINLSTKPVMLIGSGIRTSNSVNDLLNVIQKLKIPVLSATYNADTLPINLPYYYGMFGIIGGRAGNFILQNADLIICVGCRMTYRHIGYNYQSFAKNARKIVIDVDEEELKKTLITIDVPIRADLRHVFASILASDYPGFSNDNKWIEYCERLYSSFPTYLDKFNKSDRVNPYYFSKKIFDILPDDGVIVLGNSSIASHFLQMGIRKNGQRLICNMNCGSMGYDLPASIGAVKGLNRDVLLVTGEGSFQMNLQELETVSFHALPIKIFVCTNMGYRAIVRTQSNFFNGQFTGCTADSGIGMPDIEKIAIAYDIPFYKITNHYELENNLLEVLNTSGPVICEVFQDLDQIIEPRLMSRKDDEGKIVSPELTDLFPFLSEEEVKQTVFR